MRTYVSTLKVTSYANIIYRQINHKNHSSLSLQLYSRVMDARVCSLNNKLIVKIYIWFSPCTFTQDASIHEVKNTYTWRTSCQLIEITNNLWNSIWTIHFEMSVWGAHVLWHLQYKFLLREKHVPQAYFKKICQWYIFRAVTLKLDAIFVNISINSLMLHPDHSSWMIRRKSVNVNKTHNASSIQKLKGLQPRN